MTDKKTVDNILELAKDMADKKLEKQKHAVEEKVNLELEEVHKAVEMVRSGLCYKIAEENGWVKHYVYATEEMLIEDYLGEPKNSYCSTGISFETPDPKNPWRAVFTVNGYRYYDMRYIIQRYEQDVIAEKARITRYNDQLDTMIREFEYLVKERTAIKKMLDDWTARQTEAEGEDGNA